MPKQASVGKPGAMIVAVLASPTRTNYVLAQAWRGLGIDARVLWPEESLGVLGPGDVAITRLDVLPSLDGVEPGFAQVELLEERGVRVLNSPAALLATHDKLLTAARLDAADIPHPRTFHLEAGVAPVDLPFPCVVKPRFGSWGQDVFLCRGPGELAEILSEIHARPWWLHHGALAQELIGPVREDVRVVVAGESVAAAAQRVAAESEWRTNVSLGGRLTTATVSSEPMELAVRASRAVGIDFAGVDLLPADTGWVVLELNGAVDFDERYALPGLDPYAAILDGLGIPVLRRVPRRGILEDDVRKEPAMAKSVQGKPARPGDEIVITGHSVGDSPRTAVILEVLGDPGHERFRVQWEDGHESIYFPAGDAVLKRPSRAKAKRS